MTSFQTPKHASPKEVIEKLEVMNRQEQLLNNIFLEIPSSISPTTHKFSKAFPKLGTIYTALAGIKDTQTQTLTSGMGNTYSARHHSFDIHKAKDKLSTIHQMMLVKELQGALSMLCLQTSFLFDVFKKTSRE
jgi:hypothetical protein